MHRLPPPNWNTPPSLLNRDFFMSNTNMAVPPRAPVPSFNPVLTAYRPWNQAIVPSAPFYGGSSFDNNQHFHPSQQEQRGNNFEHNRGKHASAEKPVQEYSCDVCERFFNTKQILDGHLASHVKCEQEGCSFQASRKVLKLHFIQNHAEGRMKIVLETPEQIEKWREERRKKYPTVANVEKKSTEEKEKRDKGQVAKDRTFRYRGKNQRFNNNPKRGPNRHRNHRFSNQNENVHNENNDQNSQKSCQTVKARESDISEKKDQSRDGDPLSLVLLDEEDGQSDSEVVQTKQTSEVQKPNSTPQSTPDVSSALMSLCSSYGDMSSEEEETTPNEINNNIDKEDKPSINGAEHSPAEKENIVEKSSNSSPRRRKRAREQGHRRGVVKQAKRKPTLLEKLLAPEIRHESNVILQCIRYIVKNNFFAAVPQENIVVIPSS